MSVARFIAIVGSGPAGFYAVDELLRRGHSVDMIDRLPTPFGLVRAGVAPDHQKTKAVTRAFDRTASHPKFRFYGNLEIGRDCDVPTLASYYDAVIFAHGAAGERELNVPGECEHGVFSAQAFVGWYNGHPDFSELSISIPHDIAIIGNGNVTADIARMLLMSSDQLCRTDIADHALAVLCRPGPRNVHIIGRRGPAESRFSSPELKELLTLPGVDVHLAEEFSLDEDYLATLGADATTKVELFRVACSKPKIGSERQLIFHFNRRPMRVTDLAAGGGIDLVDSTGSGTHLPCGLLVKSVGNEGRALPGLPFDADTSIVPNNAGRIEIEGRLSGLYVTGWAKRGASGTVGTNRLDSQETCATLVSDLPSLPARAREPDALYARLAANGVRLVSFADWKVIDSNEVRGGRGIKPREKYVRIEGLLRAITPHTGA